MSEERPAIGPDSIPVPPGLMEYLMPTNDFPQEWLTEGVTITAEERDIIFGRRIQITPIPWYLCDEEADESGCVLLPDERNGEWTFRVLAAIRNPKLDLP